MIQSRLEVRNLIKALNELEKLKLLLFDKDQYVLFEHIPKPVLIEMSQVVEKSSKKGDGRTKEFLMTNGTSFWSKKNDSQKKEEEFERALNAVKKKRVPNVIVRGW